MGNSVGNPDNAGGIEVDARRMSRRVINWPVVVLLVLGLGWLLTLQLQQSDTIHDLRKTIDTIEDHRIAQCDEGNDLRSEIRGKVIRLGDALGARPATRKIIRDEFTFDKVNCENPDNK